MGIREGNKIVYISIVICILFFICFAVSLIKKDGCKSHNPFLKMAFYIFRWCQENKKLLPVLNDRYITDNMRKLYPYKNADKKANDFVIHKISLFLTIIFIGNVSVLCLYLSSRMEERVADGARIIRNDWGAGNYMIELEAQGENNTEIIRYQISERELTKQEAQEMLAEAEKQLPIVILNGNKSLKNVNKNLSLINRLPQYPFTISWKSSNYQILSGTGEISADEVSINGENVVLTAILTYLKYKWEVEIAVVIKPPELTPQEYFIKKINELLLINDQKNKTHKYLLLPEKIDSEVLVWREHKVDYSILIFFLSLTAAFLVFKSSDKDLSRKVKKRNARLLLEYAGFINKLRLYLGAGLSVKNAFYRMAEEYQGLVQRGNERNYLSEEIVISCHEFANGITEETVYENFGKRCEQIQYRKLTFLLTGNLRQGNDKILAVLSQEAEEALEERISLAKKRGEEAGTKLLLPMMLMLLIVMFLILIPAYMNF